MQPRFDVYPDKAGQWRWTFDAANGLKWPNFPKGYVNRADCLHGLSVMKQYAANATVNVLDPQKVVNALLGSRRGLFG